MLGSAVLACAALLYIEPASAQGAPRKPNSVQSAVYFNAAPKDVSYCDLRVIDQSGTKTLAAAPPVTNPAMTCPDMFSWNDQPSRSARSLVLCRL
jgi:hypothetical protein